ncbi:NAD-dependent succinate-semialdehyde dehydrogenase [Dyella sp. C9]|uniref:NAD-dependent succinate-semialdehyde dehydrogenase n=1 Tax=Dyella sp. C9 TaxID=2202154 RepID=UPI000DEFC81A|nr:NAD-dependent succinate-semialdehyde dehydrogenase [Dyella sp. C9]
MSHYASINPVDGTPGARFASLAASGIEAALATSASAFASWRHTSVAHRAELLDRIADCMLAEKHALAELAVAEMGKILPQALAEVEKCASICRHYAQHGEALLATAPVAMPQGKASVRLLPLGAVLAVMPWNFPFLQIMRFVAPALLGGNVGLVKPAGNTPQCALALERIMRQAGLPAGVCQVVLLRTEDIAGVIADPRVAAVTLTGSERAGQAVASAAGLQLKKCVLELGGSDAFVVMPSADIEKAAGQAVIARLNNNGQSCVCAKRFIVHEKVYDRFATAFVAAMQAARVGDPMAEGVQLGPLSSERARHDLHAQVEHAKAQGARVLLGGELPDGTGYFYPATVLADIPEHAPIRQEEFFGPVAMLFKVRSLDEAIAVSNETPFGLGSAIWTGDEHEAEAYVRQADAGITAVNALVVSDARLPFGGVKRSGYGRELSSAGLLEFLNMKSVIGA